ncbi:hypothetical protein RFI_19105 [Reticulomyxa filosa]|uniref:Uncharacterized protein n=1 Tax=Reticulomyxa filosa TaxID=46433 RepID=X6MVZ7_RETFI|nr:hypothetical protein RFI_19105 [Reticulomyxa filosa]|eukprot:ETO18173.1 hypothetical protein RFI_19105 [Reticulomyxa filosa]
MKKQNMEYDYDHEEYGVDLQTERRALEERRQFLLQELEKRNIDSKDFNTSLEPMIQPGARHNGHLTTLKKQFEKENDEIRECLATYDQLWNTLQKRPQTSDMNTNALKKFKTADVNITPSRNIRNHHTKSGDGNATSLPQLSTQDRYSLRKSQKKSGSKQLSDSNLKRNSSQSSIVFTSRSDSTMKQTQDHQR